MQPWASPWVCGHGFHVQTECGARVPIQGTPLGLRAKSVVHVDGSCWVCTTSIHLMSTDVGMCWMTLLFMLPFWDVGPCEGLPVSCPPGTYHFTMLNKTKWPAGRVAWLLASGSCGPVLGYSQGPGMALCHLHTLATACLRPVLSVLSFTPAVSAHAREETYVCACECEKWG